MKFAKSSICIVFTASDFIGLYTKGREIHFDPVEPID